MKGLWKWTLAASLLCVTAIASAQTKFEGEYKLPAPGCPKEYIAEDSLRWQCQKMEQGACVASPQCKWWPGRKGADGSPDMLEHCEPRSGQFIKWPSPDPTKFYELPLYLLIDPASLDPTANDLGKRAYSAAARKRYDEAIRLYTQAISSLGEGHSEFQTSFRVRRGLVYELKRDKSRALGDYSESLVYALNWQSEQIANARIKQLTEPGSPVLAMPLFQESGILRTIPGRAVAPLSIVVPVGHDHLIKLRGAKSNREEMLIYVQAGTTFKMKVPLGTYRVTGARGTVWYGTDLLFGGETKYFRLEKNDGDDLYQFNISADGRQVLGWTMQFHKVQHGNLLTPEIRPEDF